MEMVRQDKSMGLLSLKVDVLTCNSNVSMNIPCGIRNFTRASTLSLLLDLTEVQVKFIATYTCR